MSGRKGVDGREVPGAALTNGESTKKIGSTKKNKRAGRRHKKTHGAGQTAEQTVQGDAALVNEGKTPEDEHPEDVNPELTPPNSDDNECVGGVTIQPASEVVEQWTESNTIVTENTSGQLSNLTINDNASHETETGWHESSSNAMTDNTWARSTTPAEWADSVVGDIVTRTTSDGKQQTYDHTETKRQVVSDWFESQTGPVYRNLSTILRQRIIDHLFHIKYTEGYDEEWSRTLRLVVWKAVVRANFFWLQDGVPTGKAKPILRPAGVHENNFEAFVQCAAERLDRINKDLPNPEYVKKVEDEVRGFLTKAEDAGMHKQLKHLALLLFFDEEQRKTALRLEDMQDRIRRAFLDVDLGMEEFEVMKKGGKASKHEHPGHTVVVADTIWHDAISKL